MKAGRTGQEEMKKSGGGATGAVAATKGWRLQPPTREGKDPFLGLFFGIFRVAAEERGESEGERILGFL